VICADGRGARNEWLPCSTARASRAASSSTSRRTRSTPRSAGRRPHRRRALGPRRPHRLLEARHRRRAGRDRERRPHRQARPRPRATEGFFDDLAPGDYVVHNVHGVARFAGMVTRSMGGAERDYLLLEYRGGDRLTCPPSRSTPSRPTRRRIAALNRMGGTEWSRRRGCAPRSGRWPRSSSSCTGDARPLPATRSRPTHPGRPSSSRPSSIRRPRTSSRRSTT